MQRDRPEARDKPFTIAGIGEVLWDIFPNETRFGGAPANFACTASGLAGREAAVSIVSAVGTDDLGKDALRSLQKHDVQTEQVAQLTQPTGQVHISLDDSGSASYRFAENCAWDNLQWSDQLDELARSTDAVCFGTLGQRSDVARATIQRFVRSTRAECLRVFDVNLRPPFYTDDVVRESLDIANVLKLNDDELPLVADLIGLTGSDNDLLPALADACDLSIVALTKGANGATIFRDGAISESSGFSTNVVDTVGAGDAFTATMTLGVLRGTPTDDIVRLACEVAAFVCSQTGATPPIPNHLARPPRS